MDIQLDQAKRMAAAWKATLIDTDPDMATAQDMINYLNSCSIPGQDDSITIIVFHPKR